MPDNNIKNKTGPKLGSFFSSPFVGFLGNLGSGLVSNAISAYNAREQRNWQESMMDKMNAYNSPLADKLRKMAAGVNPFSDTGAVPSASAGSVPPAQTFPIADPLSALKTFSEVRNISAAVGKTESETEMMLKQMVTLDLAFERGLLEFDEYKKRLNMMFEAWEKHNPYEVELDKTESETNKNLSEVTKNEAFTDVAGAEVTLKEAQTAVADAQASYIKAQEEYQRILSSNADAESKARVEQLKASAQASLAAAYESSVRAQVAEIQKQHLSNEEQRAQELHVIKKEAEEYARDLGATNAQLAELHREMEERWHSDVPVWGNILDFVHHNLSLGGTASKAFK